MPPIGIAYLQAYLACKNIKADILDLNNVFYNLVRATSRSPLQKSWLISCNTFLEENIIDIIQKDFPSEFNGYINKILEYDIVGFSCFKSNFKTTVEIIKILKAQKSNIKIILGGPEITRQFYKTNGEFNMRANNYPPAGRAGSPLQADLLVVGEGEKALYDYIVGTHLNNHEKISKFNQLENLEDLPYPKFQGINTYPRKDTVPLLFSRGCVRKCNFCSEKLLYIGFRTRPAKNLIEEIRHHLANKIKYFVFFDSMLNADLRKLEKFCDAVIANFGSINWEAQIAVRKDMDKAFFEKIKKSGCYNLFIGLESGSDNTLKKMNKGFTGNDAVEFFKKLNNAGLFFGISLIAGYPGETEKDFKESLDFVINNKALIPKIEQINPFTYYDGTNTDEATDYKLCPESMKRMEIFIEEIKKHNFKYTNAFLGNLVEKTGETK
ncbi:MAG: B12-binding domain-containing radical SAM protein [bacterium]|nr:B12-binding domain-containing radical SAM protein [bacterium]